MGLIAKEIQSFSQDQINELDKTGELTITSSEKSITLTVEDVEISSQDIPGWLVANSNGITVALDITISEELRKEGIARELVNRIQNIRKYSGFEVTDKIVVKIPKEIKINEAATSATVSNLSNRDTLFNKSRHLPNQRRGSLVK
jgi:isoleucyl-tRNA synthetase